MPKDYLDPKDDLTEEDWEIYEEMVREEEEEEEELRQMARQQGLRLVKARLDRVTDSGKVVYGHPWATENARYTLVDKSSGAVVYGEFVEGRSLSLADLDQVRAYLTKAGR
jgi:hypothetical protein